MEHSLHSPESIPQDANGQNMPIDSDSVIKTNQNCSINRLVLLLLFIALGAAGFFGYNYFRLIATVPATEDVNSEITQVGVPTTAPTLTTAPTFTPAPTIQKSNLTGWKTYLDSAHQVSIDYPGDWYSPESGNPAQFFNYDVAKAPGRSFDPQLDRGMLKIELYFTGDTAPLEEFAENRKRERYGDDGEWSVRKTTINGYQAILFDTSYFIKNPYTKENLILTFGLDFNNNQQLRDKILTTVKFVEDKSSDSVQDSR